MRCSNAINLIRAEAKRLAIAVVEQTRQLRRNRTQLAELAERLVPGLQRAPWVGPVTAAILICAYSHHGRVGNRGNGAVAAIPALVTFGCGCRMLGRRREPEQQSCTA